MIYRSMGKTGVQVSELCLGAMNFGMPDWGVGEKESVEVIHAFLDAGGNFIDTADVYGGGVSEEICGRALKDRRARVIVATKGHFPVTARFGEPPAHANALGSSRRHLALALEDSLRRLQTDYIDLYQVHCWDTLTPIEETLGTLDAFVKSGKIRYAGLSNFTAWQIAEARQLCIRFGWEPFVTAQMQYSLVCRDIEAGVIPVCERYGIGVLPWSPLGGGVLSGKYSKNLAGPAGSRFGEKHDPANAWRQRFVNERNLAIADAVKSVAVEHETSSTAVALAWVLGRPMMSSVIIGPKTAKQLKDNVAACEVKLSEPARKRLDEISAPAPTYPEWFITQTPRNASSAG